MENRGVSCRDFVIEWILKFEVVRMLESLHRERMAKIAYESEF